MPSTIHLSDEVLGNRHFTPSAEIERAKLAVRNSGVCPVPLHRLRVWDALATNLPATPAADDLGLVTGTWGTNAPYAGTGDAKATTVTRRAGFFVAVPHDFAPGGSLSLRAYCGMKTTVSDTTATLDFEAYRLDEDGTLGSADLVATAAQSINSLTTAAKTFALDEGSLEPGDILYVRMTVAVVDGATGTAVIGAVYGVQLLADLW